MVLTNLRFPFPLHAGRTCISDQRFDFVTPLLQLPSAAQPYVKKGWAAWAGLGWAGGFARGAVGSTAYPHAAGRMAGFVADWLASQNDNRLK